MKRANFPDRRDQRKKEAEKRQAIYNKVPLDRKLETAGDKEKKKLLKKI
jgi:hypothetical protein